MINVFDLFPKAQNRPITVREAFLQLPELELDTPVAWGNNPNWAVSKYIPRIKQGGSCDDVHPKKAGYNLIRLHSQKVSPTIPKTCNGSLFAGLLPPEGNRYCSIQELKRLASFPDDFQLIGKFRDQWACIGNSVPPLFMRAIALQIRSEVFDKSTETSTNNPRNSYLQILDAAWRQHLAPRLSDAPTVISTFAGAGGSSLGYSMAGYRELLAVEWDNNAVETFKLNFPDVPVYHGDIAKLSVDECLQMAGIQAGELDVFDGSPPCQGFSAAGKRMMDDPRNQLFREYVRLLRGLQPKVFVMENVSGMVKGKMKLVFVEILKELKASGYQVKACLLNAMYFNVPQSRQRMIFIGVRNDLGIVPSHPKAQHKILNGTALLPDELQNKRFLTWRKKFKRDTLRPLGSVPITVTRKGIDLEGREVFSDASIVQIFQSFPTQFLFTGTNAQSVMRIGNSVPPLFMRAIAQHIREQILDML